MKVLVIGSGGREHAIALAVSQSSRCTSLLCAPGNPGMADLGECRPVDVNHPEAMLALAQQEQVDFTIVGPEIPLVAGVVDLFRRHGLSIFGPTAAAAALEGSKAFSKEIMQKYGVPTAAFETFTDLDQALAYLQAHPAPVVVKASGLAAGKGAIVCMTDQEAQDAVHSMLGSAAVFGESGKTVVIEEFMQGEEASIFAVCDGRDYVVLSTAQDHKRIYDQDQGPNTGGMGAYAPAPIADQAMVDLVSRTIIEPTLDGMRKEGAPYTGVLYVGIMVTEQGPKVVEYNVRFGDPEAQVVIPLYQGDFLELLSLAAQGSLKELPSVKNSEQSAVVVVLASQGYPGSYPKGHSITGLQEAESRGVRVLHAGTRLDEKGRLVTHGGRVLGVVGQGSSLQEAVEQTYAGLAAIDFEGCYFRKDIAQKGLKRCLN